MHFHDTSLQGNPDSLCRKVTDERSFRGNGNVLKERLHQDCLAACVSQRAITTNGTAQIHKEEEGLGLAKGEGTPETMLLTGFPQSKWRLPTYLGHGEPGGKDNSAGRRERPYARGSGPVPRPMGKQVPAQSRPDSRPQQEERLGLCNRS
ncbi:hypothetical protein SKAU_G00007630 [Synaphobranchus kaupii]|uniref:Uncharacterized protein n=1 Tax=Synaphobranchus kaupii TaxID=118154 RepID=A0A9Q1G9E7_SYNKA|nr:hypothetical protein SKAU_G00007630 [Synaphobranchus kaupii]